MIPYFATTERHRSTQTSAQTEASTAYGDTNITNMSSTYDCFEPLKLLKSAE